MLIKRALYKESSYEICLKLDEKCNRGISYPSQIEFFQLLDCTCPSGAICPLQVPVEEEVDCVMDVLGDVLSVLLLLSLVSCLLFLDLLFGFFAEFFIFQVDLDSFFAFFHFAILIFSFTSCLYHQTDSKDLQPDHFLTSTKFETKYFFL